MLNPHPGTIVPSCLSVRPKKGGVNLVILRFLRIIKLARTLRALRDLGGRGRRRDWERVLP